MNTVAFKKKAAHYFTVPTPLKYLRQHLSSKKLMTRKAYNLWPSYYSDMSQPGGKNIKEKKSREF